MEYQIGPRTRARSASSFGAGILSGRVLSDDDMMQKVQENINFRIQSARKMLMGETAQEGTQPLERRQVLRERRLSLVVDRGSSSDVQKVNKRKSTSSGRIGEGDMSSDTSQSTNVNADVPSMSTVDRGTKERAMDRGFRG